MSLIERLLNFQETNATIRFFIKKKGMGTGELYWAAMTKALAVKESL
jgi:hypothetical protein